MFFWLLVEDESLSICLKTTPSPSLKCVHH